MSKRSDVTSAVPVQLQVLSEDVARLEALKLAMSLRSSGMTVEAICAVAEKFVYYIRGDFRSKRGRPRYSKPLTGESDVSSGSIVSPG
jgi:hypothetical protein